METEPDSTLKMGPLGAVPPISVAQPQANQSSQGIDLESSIQDSDLGGEREA